MNLNGIYSMELHQIAVLSHVYMLIIEPLLKSIRIMFDALYDKNYLTWGNFWSLTANKQ